LSKNHLFDECVVVIRDMVDDFLQTDPLDREAMEFVLAQGTKTAQLAARTQPTKTKATIEMYKQLARIDVSYVGTQSRLRSVNPYSLLHCVGLPEFTNN